MLVIDWRLRYRRQGWILGEYCRCGSMASRLLVLRNHGFLVLSVSRTLMWKVLLTAVDLASCLVILVSFKCLEKFGVVMRLDEMWLEEDILSFRLKSSTRYVEGMIYSYVIKSNDRALVEASMATKEGIFRYHDNAHSKQTRTISLCKDCRQAERSMKRHISACINSSGFDLLQDILDKGDILFQNDALL